MRKAQKALVPIILFSMFTSVIQAETVRGPVVALLKAPAPDEQPISVTLNVGDIASIDYPADDIYVEGVEIEVVVPEAVRRVPGNFAVVLYRDITPKPQSGVMTLKGSRLLLAPIPIVNRLFLILPTRSPNDLHSGPGTLVADSESQASDFPILVTIQPIAKGIPSAIMDAPFQLRISTVSIAKGGLSLTISSGRSSEPIVWGTDSATVTVTLNGEPLDYQKTPYLLDPGIYRISIQSSTYQSEYRTFTVDQGTTTAISVELQKPTARARFDAPQGATVFLDGAQVDTSRQITIEPGEHTVLFHVGDYTVSKRFTAIAKKDYEISLFLDIMINETK